MTSLYSALNYYNGDYQNGCVVVFHNLSGIFEILENAPAWAIANAIDERANVGQPFGVTVFADAAAFEAAR